jgi:hypothetical protein
LNFDCQIVFIRDPLSRAVSHFHYVKQRLPDNGVTVRRHPEVRAIKDGVMTIDEFVKLNHVRYFYSRYYLRDLLIDKRLLVIPMSAYKSGCHLLTELLGIKIDSDVWVNKTEHSENFDYLTPFFSEDHLLYTKLIGLSPVSA